MNTEYRSAVAYIATSSWFSEHEFIKPAETSRALAQFSVTRFMRIYNFLNYCQQNPFIFQDVSFSPMPVFSLESVIIEMLSNYRDRNNKIFEMENIAITTNHIKIKLFIEKIKPFYLDEAGVLFSFVSEIPLLNNINLESECYIMSEIVRVSEPLPSI